MMVWGIGLLLLQTAAGTAQGQYADAALCARCHPAITARYRQTGMARSFFRPRAEISVEDYENRNRYYHAASDRSYRMFRRDGAFYQRRHQAGYQGREENVVEMRVDFVLGSGNHARAYLHQTEDGRLLQLPVAWYSMEGGFWAMAPGYDRADHAGFRREIDRECIFCHTGYPAQVPEGEAAGDAPVFRGSMQEGIDCQRCHGPGLAHARAAESGAPSEEVRRAIVNPARLAPERQMEICMQCHLEPASGRLPYTVRRAGRGVFSYRPGEPLADYALFFDYGGERGNQDRFEVNHAAYRLRKSSCFRKAEGITCTTCHDPHAPARGEEAQRRYDRACSGCHAAAVELPGHPARRNCADCHMPERRTEDAIHVVLTDHQIQRPRPDTDLTVPRPETHEDGNKGVPEPVVPFYPPKLPREERNELDVAVAQVRDGVNLLPGIERLARAIQKYRPPGGVYEQQLGEAWSKAGEYQPAIAAYREALGAAPELLPAWRGLALALLASGKASEAAAAAREGLAHAPRDSRLLNALGAAYQQKKQHSEAAVAFRRAIEATPEIPEPYVNLGASLWEMGDAAGAEAAFRETVRLAPEFASAHNNLANVLAARGHAGEAGFHFRKALELQPDYAAAHLNYGRFLGQRGMTAEARVEFRAAARTSNPAIREAALAALRQRR